MHVNMKPACRFILDRFAAPPCLPWLMARDRLKQGACRFLLPSTETTMKLTPTRIAASTLLLASLAGQAPAQTSPQQRPQAPIETRTQTEAEARIYGSQLMTPQERNEYQDRMRQLNTEQEREAFRMDHQQRMDARAREQGLTLPLEPRKETGGAKGSGAGKDGGGARPR